MQIAIRHTMRKMRWLNSRLLGALLAAASLNVAAGYGSFTGAWREETCHKEQGSEDEKCFVSSLYLVHQGPRICGSHFFMHPNTNMDEGEGISLIGTVVGSTLVATITSGRDQSQYLVRAELVKDRLRWKVVETTRKGDGGLDPFIWNAEMSRIRDQEAMASVATVCTEHFRARP
jgi:hypothetical protein